MHLLAIARLRRRSSLGGAVVFAPPPPHLCKLKERKRQIPKSAHLLPPPSYTCRQITAAVATNGVQFWSALIILLLFAGAGEKRRRREMSLPRFWRICLLCGVTPFLAMCSCPDWGGFLHKCAPKTPLSCQKRENKIRIHFQKFKTTFARMRGPPLPLSFCFFFAKGGN